MLHLNWMSVFIAAIAAFIFGAVYYTLLGPKWIAAQGKTMEQCKAEMAGKPALARYYPFILSFVGALIMGWALYGILTHMGRFTVRAGAISGALCWIGFVLTTITVNNAYTGRKATLTVIDGAHWLGVLIIIGAIVGYFGP